MSANAAMPEPEDDVEASRAPLIDHLIELRSRLIRSVIAIVIAFGICFAFADDIFNILIKPYEASVGSGPEARFIFTAPQEFLITQLKLAFFGAMFLAFPIIASQIYMFVAPGLYKDERHAFLPYLIATPILFLIGAALVYFGVMPLALQFFMGMQQEGGEGRTAIELMPRVSEYLSLIMTMLFAFGMCCASCARPDRNRQDRGIDRRAFGPLCHRHRHPFNAAGRPRQPAHCHVRRCCSASCRLPASHGPKSGRPPRPRKRQWCA